MARGGALAALLAAVALLATAGGSGAATYQTPKRGGTVVFGPVNEFGCLNPLVDACAFGPQFFWIVEEVLAPAFSVAPDFSRRPNLVSGVTFTRKPPFTLTYTIRPEARWSDGVPVTAKDFVFTHRALVARKDIQSDDPDLLVRSIRVVSTKRFEVVLRRRAAGWRDLFPLVLPQHALEGQNLARIWAAGIDDPKTGRPIGSGPFLVERWQRGKQLTLVRNPRYWGPHPAYLNRLVIRFCSACSAPPPAEVLDGLRRGAVDVAYARDTSIVPDLRRIRGVEVRGLRSAGWEHLTLRGLELMQAQLRRAGIETVLSYTTSNAFFDEILPSGRFDGASFAWVNVSDPDSYLGVYGCGGDQNWSGYCQRIVTDDLGQADRILDPKQRARVLNRADRLLATDVPVIPLYQIPWVLAYKSSLRNVVPSPANIFWNAENWWLDR